MSSLAACGGGGGDGGTTGAGQSPPPGSNTNSAPTIQGQPGNSIVVGQSYSFQPSASDADGDTLTFSVTNLPAWASFNASTGRISGTPTSADIATYSGITVRVSDGTASAALAAFSISVVATGVTGSASLSWTPPTQNLDGSTLTNLSGYLVLYGRDQNALTESVSLTNSSLSTYRVENLSSGTWYFAVLAVNSTGVASPLSNLATKTIG